MDMDFRRTLKKRRLKSHVKERASIAPTTGHKPKSRRIHTKRRRTVLKLAVCFALFLGLATVTQGHTEDYYIYQTAKGELVISNKQPPPDSTIIKQLPGETASAQEPGKPPPNVKPEDSPKPHKDK